MMGCGCEVGGVSGEETWGEGDVGPPRRRPQEDSRGQVSGAGLGVWKRAGLPQEVARALGRERSAGRKAKGWG